MVAGNSTYYYEYNADGIRTSKSTHGGKVSYRLNGSQIVAEESASTLCVYLYDSDGSPIGMQYRTEDMAEGEFYTFWFEKNLQGDVVAIYNSKGVKMFSYVYDAWGNQQTIRESHTSESNYAKLNPFGYRGYYRDSETGFYYLQSRYYDPYTGRFINADDEETLTATLYELTDKNLFAYCDNNPIMRYDNDGEFWKELKALGKSIVKAAKVVGTVAAVTGTIVVAAAVTIGSGGAGGAVAIPMAIAAVEATVVTVGAATTVGVVGEVAVAVGEIGENISYSKKSDYDPVHMEDQGKKTETRKQGG